MLIIHASIKVNPAKKAAFLEEVKPLLAASQAEEGNISYDLYEQAGQDGSFLMVEVWKSPEAIELHNNSAHFKGFTAKAPEFLIAPLSIDVYSGEPVRK